MINRWAHLLDGERVGCVALFALSIWLRAAFPVLGPDSEWDDMLFVRLAAHIRNGEWLGPYGNLTLAKGAAFSLFIAAIHPTGIPFKLAEHFAYLCAACFCCAAIARNIRVRGAFLVLFALLALNPLAWAPEAGGRVVREGLYTSLGLVLIGGALRLPAITAASPATTTARHAAAMLYGMASGLYWLTREEGLWLVPALLIPVLAWFVGGARVQGLRRFSWALARVLALPLVGFILVVVVVNALNYRHYGVFRNNDFRSADFEAAYGALSRVGHDRYVRFVVFPKDARVRAYSVSPAARELEPFFEGEGGRFWARVGCVQTPIRPCDEILSGWFMWAFRDAVARVGHYRNAHEARRFYQQLAREINVGCDSGRIPCLDTRRTLVPPWRMEFLAWTGQSAASITWTLAVLGNMTVRTLASEGSEAQLALMRSTTHDRISTATDPKPGGLRSSIARAITGIQRILLLVGMPLGMIAALGLALRRPSSMSTWTCVVLATLATVIAARIGLLAFLDATSIPANSLLYLSPAVPFALAFGPAALMAAASALKPSLLRRQDQ